MDPSVLSHDFKRLGKKAGLEDIHFHSLRHSFASLMLLKRVHPEIVSSLLGPARVGFTLGSYSHIISGMEDDALKLYGEVLPDGVVQKNNTDLTPTFRN